MSKCVWGGGWGFFDFFLIIIQVFAVDLQARTEPATKKRFINDTIRNDFHKKFISKYIQ